MDMTWPDPIPRFLHDEVFSFGLNEGRMGGYVKSANPSYSLTVVIISEISALRNRLVSYEVLIAR